MVANRMGHFCNWSRLFVVQKQARFHCRFHPDCIDTRRQPDVLFSVFQKHPHGLADHGSDLFDLRIPYKPLQAQCKFSLFHALRVGGPSGHDSEPNAVVGYQQNDFIRALVFRNSPLFQQQNGEIWESLDARCHDDPC